MIASSTLRCAGAGAALLLLSACGVFHGAVKDPAADQARTELNQLKADPRLANRVPVALKDAEDAVALAEAPQKDAELSGYLSYIAERKVQTARALSEARVAEDQLRGMGGP